MFIDGKIMFVDGKDRVQLNRRVPDFDWGTRKGWEYRLHALPRLESARIAERLRVSESQEATSAKPIRE
jgi:hypothetical protein